MNIIKGRVISKNPDRNEVVTLLTGGDDEQVGIFMLGEEFSNNLILTPSQAGSLIFALNRAINEAKESS